MSVALLLDQAFRLQNQGQLAQAEKLYGQALLTVRDNPALWFNHGLVLRDLERPAEALASFDQALRLSPAMAEIQNERAGALLALDRPAEALAALDRSLIDLATYFRDALMVAAGAGEVAPSHPDMAEKVAALAAHASADRLLRCIEAVLGCRQALATNVKPKFAVDAMVATVGEALRAGR